MKLYQYWPVNGAFFGREFLFYSSRVEETMVTVTWMVLMSVLGTTMDAAFVPVKFIDEQDEGDCDGPLGLESGQITDGQLTASSEWDWNHGARRGRLNIQQQGVLRGAWSSRRNDGNQWLQIDLFDETSQVTGVATQGRADWNQWVTKYRLQYSVDGVTFQFYKEQGQSANKEFTGNTDRNTIVRHDLNPPITARFIRFRPVSWFGHISMRAELYGCFSGECLKPLGMQSGEIPDEQLSASSEWDKNHGAKRGRLNIKKEGALRGSWSSRRNDQNQWLQIDLRTRYTAVRGIATQGRDDWNQWVTRYRLQYGNDGNNFEFYTEDAGQSAIKEFTGNKDRFTIVFHKLRPVLARFIRILPRSWYWHISMRVELYGCPALVKNMDSNGDGFASKSEVESFGLVWKGNAEQFDLNGDGKLSPEESKIMTYISKYDTKQLLCHFKATDTNHDSFVTAGELEKRFKDFKYDITPEGVAEFIKESDVDKPDNKLNFHEFSLAMFGA